MKHAPLLCLYDTQKLCDCTLLVALQCLLNLQHKMHAMCILFIGVL